VDQVEPVGYEQARGHRRHPQPGSELGAGELRHLRRAGPTEAAGALPAGLWRLLGVQGVGVVEVGVLDRDLDDLDLTPVPLGGEDFGVVEQLAARQVLDRHHIHVPTQA
jgi:hypothetical protein